MPGQRILVKAAGSVPGPTLSLNGISVAFTASPLFQSIGRNEEIGAAPIGAIGMWYVLTSSSGFGEQNPWDTCHALLQQGFGVAGAPSPEFAEPDIPQQWLTGDDSEVGLRLNTSCEKPDDQDLRFPTNSNPFWFRDDLHAQFDAALLKIGGTDASPNVRIAHLDTGYDPNHKFLPNRLLRERARNFVASDNPDDASELSDGLVNNMGHGTGTICILSGSAGNGSTSLGGAPFAEVIPLRVANRVVLFFTSAIAKAFDHVHQLNSERQTPVDIITMSMGGLASRAWAEAVNALYDQGVFIVTAAGNNFGNLPTRNIVYPARFNRVVAACGVMANELAYADLDISRMAGNYGPSQKMRTAISAYTPNVPWAKIGCSEILDLNGAGTSSATPQVAAAAALWIQHNRAQLERYPEPWMRVEAIRKALFDSAKLDLAEKERLGRGAIRAREALDVAPAAVSVLKREQPDAATFPILRTLTGLDLQVALSPRERMIELEALQLSQSIEIEKLLPDPDVPIERIASVTKRCLAEALADHPAASQCLRDALQFADREKLPIKTFLPVTSNAVQALWLKHAISPQVPNPTRRPLRVYACDPSLGARLGTLDINEATLDVCWEDDLKPGPIGEYIEVVDIDPASRRCYAPVDLNHPNLLTTSGLPPSEANPQFHQQMVYAVAMKTIEHFEDALGRVALWAPQMITQPDGEAHSVFVRRLRIYPHALRAKNAFYSPARKSLLLGYFKAGETNVGDVLPKSVIFTAVSHDIIAHETTHALLDGLNRRFREPTNKDVLAFHEGFADIVALFQHFTLPAALRDQIRQTRGDLEKQNLLAKLAVQFGQATGRYGALRDAIGRITEKEEWEPAKANPNAYQEAIEAHDLGAVLVAAVFDAFLQIYKRRTADLIRLATSGTGILSEGDIPSDLVDRLAQEASKVASHVLSICIRALDYCPPIDLRFGEYLRALITADTDLVPNDTRGYRTAFIAAFRDRGIYPTDVRHLAAGSLLWEPPPLPLRSEKVKEILKQMSLIWDKDVGRKAAYDASEQNAEKFWDWLMDPTNVSDDEMAALGLVRIESPQQRKIGNFTGELRKIEVHSVRPSRRVGPDRRIHAHLVVQLTQTFRPMGLPGARYRGGCTLLIDIPTAEVRYLIRKKVESAERLREVVGFADEQRDGLRGNYFSEPSGQDEPFAILHRAR